MTNNFALIKSMLDTHGIPSALIWKEMHTCHLIFVALVHTKRVLPPTGTPPPMSYLKGSATTSIPLEGGAPGRNATINTPALPAMNYTQIFDMTKPTKGNIQKLPSPIQLEALAKYLKGYTDANYLINGFTEGFLIDFEGEDMPLSSTNSLTADSNPEAVSQKLHQELSLARIKGPFPHAPFPNFKVSPLSLREKQEGGKFRLLHNLSYPYDLQSVNANIPPEAATVHYQNITDAIHLIH